MERWYEFYKSPSVYLDAYLLIRDSIDDRKIYTIYKDDPKLLKYLTTPEEPVEKVIDGQGNTVLHVAVIMERRKVFDYLLSLDSIPLDPINDDFNSPLLIALKSSYEYYAMELILKGADLNLADENGDTPLHWAVSNQLPKIAQILIEKGADINKQNVDGRTPLHIASKHNFVEETFMLLCYNSDVDIRDNSDCKPLDLAIISSSFDIQEMLLYYTCDYFTEYEIKLEHLMFAFESNSPIVRRLIKYVSESDITYSNIGKLFFLEPDHVFMMIYCLKDTLRYAFNTLTFHKIPPDFLFSLYSKNRYFYSTIDIFLKSTLKHDTIHFFKSIHHIIEKLDALLPRNWVDQLIYLLLSYGMNITEDDLYFVYMMYGYCDLFEILLKMDITFNLEKFLNTVHPRVLLMYDITMYIDAMAENFNSFPEDTLYNFMCISAHQNLKEYCLRSDSLLLINKAKKLPSIPSLLELARNKSREYIADKFRIQSTKEFYGILKKLNLGKIYEKILTYQIQVY